MTIQEYILINRGRVALILNSRRGGFLDVADRAALNLMALEAINQEGRR